MSRRSFYLLGFGALAVCDTLTQVSFKLATGRTGPFTLSTAWLFAAATTPWIYGAVAGYIGAFITWMKLLEHAPVGPAFAASHLDVVIVLVISVPLFGERLGPVPIAGAVLIMAGILVLAMNGSTSDA